MYCQNFERESDLVSEPEHMIFCHSDFERVDHEELLAITDTNNCQRVPTAVNIEHILRDLAVE